MNIGSPAELNPEEMNQMSEKHKADSGSKKY